MMHDLSALAERSKESLALKLIELIEPLWPCSDVTFSLLIIGVFITVIDRSCEAAASLVPVWLYLS